MVPMMENLWVYCLVIHLNKNDGRDKGCLYGTFDGMLAGSTLGVKLRCTDGKTIGSDEGIILACTYGEYDAFIRSNYFAVSTSKFYSQC